MILYSSFKSSYILYIMYVYSYIMNIILYMHTIYIYIYYSLVQTNADGVTMCEWHFERIDCMHKLKSVR